MVRGCGGIDVDAIPGSAVCDGVEKAEDNKSRQIVRRRIAILPYTPGWGPYSKMRVLERECEG